MPVPFWFWNDWLREDELLRQLREFAEKNVGGVFVHARTGRLTPYLGDEWFRLVRRVLAESEKLGLEVWFYDEDNWPSGYAGGLVAAAGGKAQEYVRGDVRPLDDAAGRNEAFAAFWLGADGAFSVAGGDDPPAHADRLLLFFREEHTFPRIFSPEPGGSVDGFVDILDPFTVELFLQTTHERYLQEVGEAFGRHARGFFVDEPSYHECAWRDRVMRLPFSETIAAAFADRYGRRLREVLPCLTHDVGDFRRVRYVYRRTLAELFAENFCRPIAAWCRKNHMLLTGHFIVEESLHGTCQTSGDPLYNYLYEDIPGIDHLGKDLDLAEFWSSSRILVKQAASVANQLGRRRVLCETFAGGGWDFGPTEVKWMGDWLYALGVNLLCPHAFHYSLRGLRKRDYPPSLSVQQPWWEFAGDVGAHFARLGNVLSRGDEVNRVLVLHPLESAYLVHRPQDYPWPDDHVNDAFEALIEHLVHEHVDFDLGGEVILDRFASHRGAQVIVGHAAYDVVIVPPARTWRASTVELLHCLVSNGGRVISLEPQERLLEAGPKLVDPAVFGETIGAWNDPGALVRLTDRLRELVPPRMNLQVPAGCEVAVAERRLDGERFFFLAPATKGSFEADFTTEGDLELWDTVTGEQRLLRRQADNGPAPVRLPFRQGTSYLLRATEESHVAARLTPGETIATLAAPGDRLPYRLLDPNAFALSHWQITADGVNPYERYPAWEAKLVLDGLPQGTPFTATCSFKSRAPGEISAELALENPRTYVIRFNDIPVGVPGGGLNWFVDAALQRVALPAPIKPGANTLVLSGKTDPDAGFEYPYLLGEFGVFAIPHNRMVIDLLPETLALGSWVEQGLPFFAGTVAYTVPTEAFSPALEKGPIFLETEIRSCAQLRQGGQVLGTTAWPPFRILLTALTTGEPLELVVATGLRNFYGPFHLEGEDDVDCLGPNAFFLKDRQGVRFRFKPAGLLGPVILRTAGSTSGSGFASGDAARHS